MREADTPLAQRPAPEIATAAQVLWRVMADSYRVDLWGAAYLINGDCSDDGFEYFRGWPSTQDRSWYERALADADSLAEHPEVRSALADGGVVEIEDALGIATDAYLAATGTELPSGTVTGRYPRLVFDRDFDDAAEEQRRLSRLSALEHRAGGG